MVAIIINPISGGGRPSQAAQRVALATRVLAAAGESGDVLVTERRGHARELATAALARGARLVVAWGGDGTVNEVASTLAFRSTPLAIVPAGSGNGLARSLGVARSPEQALSDALAASPRAIDACELDGRMFFSIAGVGFDAHVAACFDRDASGARGFGTYVRISVRELLTYRCGTYKIGEAAPCRALLITLANAAQYGNGVTIAPDARVDDGLLDLVVFQESSRVATYAAIPRLFTGGAARVRGVAIRQVEHAVIETEQPVAYHVDGEPGLGGTRLEARVHPGALNVCVKRSTIA